MLYYNHISNDIAIFYMFASVMQYVSLYMLAILATINSCIVLYYHKYIVIIIGGFCLIFRFFLFTMFLPSVIPTPWTHMVFDVLSCYLIWFY